ncbi:heparinase II/III family protein [Parasediminibacterium sp. JCM 36343]|uniref:heparinase II/III domain-containing protein n=1 Tax=Parasediminibacterium sp. JCM 36343 TaxID=3374279 RepID=UPI00397971EB
MKSKNLLAVWMAILVALVANAQKNTSLNHPYLFFTPNKLAILKQRIQTDTSISNNWASIIKEADGLLIKGDAKAKIDWLSLAYLMTNDKKYADKVKDILIKLCSKPTWSNEEMMNRSPAWNSDLVTASNCWTVAIGYDAIYDYLTKEERKTIVDGVVHNGILPALNDWVLPGTRIHTLNSMGHNWWSSCVDMAGLAAMAVLNDNEAASGWVEAVSKGSEEWMRFTGDELQFKPRTMDRSGGMYESVNYAAFGMSEYLFFKLAYANTFPGKKQSEPPVLKKMADYFLQVSYPRTGQIYSLDFGDHHITTAVERPVKLLQALGYQSNNNLWYLNQVENGQHREGLFTNTPIGIVYMPDMSKAPKVPDMPTSALFADMDWGMMRNSWEKDATMLGVKSGYTWNHSHADANSFILFHKGEDIIKDAGNSSYGTKEYSQYFCQSEAHNVMLFNGKAQPKEQEYNGSPLRGQLTELMDAGDMKYILANGVGPTSAYFSRNFRHFLWLGKVILVIDDVKAHETGKFQWLLHPGGTAKKVGGDISIVKNNAAVLVRPLFPETLVQTGYDHDFPEKMKLEEVIAPKARDEKNLTEIYYSINYPQEVRQTKFITAIILKDSVNDKNLPVIERLHNETMNGVRITQDGKVMELYLNLLADGHIMHLNSINSFNGWETDAYLLGITYPQGMKDAAPADVSDYFMAYGSYIRKDGQTVFNSLSKLYMIARKKGTALDIVLQGQPLINASFYAPQKPASFILNHQPSTFIYQQNMLGIRIDNSARDFAEGQPY